MGALHIRRLCLVLSVHAALAIAISRVWVDCDNSAGVEGVRDPDDALALIQLFNSPEVHIAGISTVFGNAPVASSTEATRQLLEVAGVGNLPLVTGASAPTDHAGADAAADAIAAQLREADSSIRIVALGPLTNIGSLATRHQALLFKIVEIIWVAGRRPGQAFRIGSHNNQTLAE